MAPRFRAKVPCTGARAGRVNTHGRSGRWLRPKPATSMSESGQNRKSSMRAHVFRFAPKSGHCATESACPFGAKPGHRDRFTRSPRRHGQEAYWHRFGKKGDYLPYKLMRCNRVAETTPNVKRYITVRFDGWNSDERRALHSATSLARQNASQ